MAIKAVQDRYLVISDLQIPFHAPKALEFCRYIKSHFKIPDFDSKGNPAVLNVGDETDQYFGSLYKKNPDATHTPTSELDDAKFELRRWYRVFPYMRLALSNHGIRYWKKALDAEIPSQLLRRYEEVIEAPDGWKWKKRWHIDCKYPFILEHGDDWGGSQPHFDAMRHVGKSIIIGHHHSVFSWRKMKTAGLEIWGATIGSLIDFETYAFEYAKRAKFKPVNGVAVIIDGGKYPMLIPYD